jgi:hypothetical protein
MKKVSLAVFLSACALTGAVHAQERPPANTVVLITDPSAVALAEQHAREAQASAQNNGPMTGKHMMHHHPSHKAKPAPKQ